MPKSKKMKLVKRLEQSGLNKPVVNKQGKDKIAIQKPGKKAKKPGNPKQASRKLYAFENIIGHKYDNQKYYYKVKWAGTDEITYEPLSQFSNSQFVEEYLFGIINKI